MRVNLEIDAVHGYPCPFFPRSIRMSEKLVNEINDLVRQSFGRYHRGDYVVAGWADVGLLPKFTELRFIATPTVELLGAFIRYEYERARLSPDGSGIVVVEKYLRKAIRYAALYEERFGKRVVIETVKSASGLYVRRKDGYYAELDVADAPGEPFVITEDKPDVPRPVTRYEFETRKDSPFAPRVVAWAAAISIVGILTFFAQSLTGTELAISTLLVIVVGLVAGELLPVLRRKIQERLTS
jgi:hypothetical protein